MKTDNKTQGTEGGLTSRETLGILVVILQFTFLLSCCGAPILDFIIVPAISVILKTPRNFEINWEHIDWEVIEFIGGVFTVLILVAFLIAWRISVYARVVKSRKEPVRKYRSNKKCPRCENNGCWWITKHVGWDEEYWEKSIDDPGPGDMGTALNGTDVYELYDEYFQCTHCQHQFEMRHKRRYSIFDS